MRVKDEIRKILISVGRWFDTAVGEGEKLEGEPPGVDWARVIPFLSLHLACLLGVILAGVSWASLAVFGVMYFIWMFSITAFYHRYFSHRTYKTSRFFQFVFALMGNSTGQRGALWWAAHHRHHHQYSDLPPDVHSPVQHGFLWSHMGWITSKTNFPTNLKAVPDLAKYPELKFLDRFDIFVPMGVAVSMYALGEFLAMRHPHLGTNGLQMLVWGYLISTVVVFHATSLINSVAHQVGSKRYGTGDESRNSFILALVTLGEGWHNNHHHFCASVRQGFYWWEIDITYYLLVVMSWFGIVWDMKEVPEHILDARKLGRPAQNEETPSLATSSAE